MSYYSDQIRKISNALYSKEYLTRQIVRARHFIDNHYADKIILAQIATEANMSKFHFQRIFKSLYGRTPNQYLTDTRIARAKELLRSGMTVAEVCVSVGLDSSTSFAGMFKKNTGSTPSAFSSTCRKKSNIGEL
jgi:AraC-like DNA-binding protein